MRLQRSGDAGGKAVAVDRQRGAGGHLVLVPLAQDQRAQCAHLLVDQADGVALRIVGAEAVRADELGEVIGVVRGGVLTRAAHFGEADLVAGLGKLPGGLAPGEPAADDVDVVGHRGRLGGLRVEGNGRVVGAVLERMLTMLRLWRVFLQQVSTVAVWVRWGMGRNLRFSGHVGQGTRLIRHNGG